MIKPQIVKDYEELDKELLHRIKLRHPEGFVDSLIRFTDADGRLIGSVLPFETEENYYLVRMTESQALSIIDDDEDYDDDGNLFDEARERYMSYLDEDFDW